MKDPLSCIALVTDSDLRFLMLEVAAQLKREHGSVIHAYCNSPQELQFYNQHNQDGLFTSVVDAAVLLRTAPGSCPDPDAVVAKARTYEQKMGVTYNLLAVANRHLGRGYALGGFHHPRSRYSEETTYLQMLHAYNTTLAFWEREFQTKGISLVLNGSKESACMARVYGLPYRAITGARYKNYHFWAWNEFYENPAIEAAYHSETLSHAGTMSEPYLTHMVNRSRFMQSTGLAVLTRTLLMTTARHVYWRLRGYEKAKGYYLGERLKHLIRVWRDHNKLNRMAQTKLADLKGKAFVFYPLQTEPEASLQMLSPEYFYQLSSIAAISRDLPAGTLLAVKECFGAIGRRPDNFYEQIAEFKNVVLLDTMELGLEVVRQAAAVVTINGTAGFEAAVMGRPAIAFGCHNTYNFLPHVKVVTKESQLKGYLHNVLNGGIDPDVARADGMRFLQAVVACSFDMRGYDYVKLHEFERQTVEDLYQLLLRSLQDQERGLAVR